MVDFTTKLEKQGVVFFVDVDSAEAGTATVLTEEEYFLTSNLHLELTSFSSVGLTKAQKQRHITLIQGHPKSKPLSNYQKIVLSRIKACE